MKIPIIFSEDFFIAAAVTQDLLFGIELTIINQRTVIAAHGIFSMEKANVQVII